MTTTQITAADLARCLRRANTHNLTNKGLHALTLLAEHDSLSQSRLASEIGVSTAVMTGVADALDRAGFTTRTTSQHDRRIVRLSLTTTGRKTLNDILSA